MKTSRSHNRRSFAQHFQATFGQVDVRKLRRRGLLALGIGAVLVTGAASADWRVYDQRVDEVLKDIRDNYIQKDGGSVTTHLKNVNERLTVKGDEFKAGDGSAESPTLVEPKEASDKLPEDKAKPTAAAGVTLAERCPGGSETATGIQAEQHKICEEMYNTEIAKYRFSLEMYDLAKKRNEKLQEIVAERNGLGEKDFGKMEENTNKLLALSAQMDNDRDRYTAYMNAYDARMLYLQKSTELLSKRAINGSGAFDPIATGVGALGLEIALETLAKTEERDCTARMQQAGVC